MRPNLKRIRKRTRKTRLVRLIESILAGNCHRLERCSFIPLHHKWTNLTQKYSSPPPQIRLRKVGGSTEDVGKTSSSLASSREAALILWKAATLIDRYSSDREETILRNVSSRRNRRIVGEFNRWETPSGKSSFPPFPRREHYCRAILDIIIARAPLQGFFFVRCTCLHHYFPCNFSFCACACLLKYFYSRIERCSFVFNCLEFISINLIVYHVYIYILVIVMLKKKKRLKLIYIYICNKSGNNLKIVRSCSIYEVIYRAINFLNGLWVSRERLISCGKGREILKGVPSRVWQ